MCVHDGEEGWGEGFVACEPHTETITLSLDYGAALSPPGSLWSTRRLDNSTSSGGQAGDAGAYHGESSTEGLQPCGELSYQCTMDTLSIDEAATATRSRR